MDAAFIHKCIKNNKYTLGGWNSQCRTVDENWRKASTKETKKRLNWLWHMLRRNGDNIVKQTLHYSKHCKVRGQNSGICLESPHLDYCNALYCTASPQLVSVTD